MFTVARNLFASWCRHRALDDERMFDLASGASCRIANTAESRGCQRGGCWRSFMPDSAMRRP
jgi:hypothetical protein